MPRSDAPPPDVRDPAVERAHFTAVVERGAALYWAEKTVAGRRRRTTRSALLMEAAGVNGHGGRILEIGCGMGDYTRALAAGTSATLIGVDVTPAVVFRLKEHVPANVRVLAGDVEALPFPDASFDAVVGNAVLHHLRLDRAIPEMLRVLRPGGRFCFAEPNFLNPQVFVERTVPWVGRRLDNSPGETAFTRWRFRRDLEQLGLDVVALRPFDFLYPLTPPRLIPAVERLGRLLERTPLVREIAGSLLVAARKPEAATAR